MALFVWCLRSFFFLKIVFLMLVILLIAHWEMDCIFVRIAVTSEVVFQLFRNCASHSRWEHAFYFFLGGGGGGGGLFFFFFFFF